MIYILRSKEITKNLIIDLNKIVYGDGRFVYQVEVKQHKAKRSLAQNKLMWEYLGQISESYYLTHGKSHSPETWHTLFKQMFLTSEIVEIRGEIIKMVKTTTKLNVSAFTDYIQKIEAYAVTELGVEFSLSDNYALAMGIK